MRILALDAEFPAWDNKYADGYQGFSCVRLDQLIYNFYELRLLKADEIGMDWKAAQVSRQEAFVSMQLEEALSWTHSSSAVGFTPVSVIGEWWYAIKDKRQGRNTSNSTSEVAGGILLRVSMG